MSRYQPIHFLQRVGTFAASIDNQRLPPGVMGRLLEQDPSALPATSVVISRRPTKAGAYQDGPVKPPLVQRLASFPLITTVGTDRTPYSLALVASSSLFMTSTSTSHQEHAIHSTSFHCFGADRTPAAPVG